MKQVHHLSIIGQPAFIVGATIDCPHCNELANLREDGSALCISGNIDFAPEHGDGLLFAMRKNFDRVHGIDVTQRHLVVPALQVASGYLHDEDGQPVQGFHPGVVDTMQRFTGLTHSSVHSRAHA